MSHAKKKPAAKAPMKMAPMRAISQVTSSVTGENLNLVCLCNDGTVWQYAWTKATWIQLAEIPQV